MNQEDNDAMVLQKTFIDNWSHMKGAEGVLNMMGGPCSLMIIGPSGAGKSTFVSDLCRIHCPESDSWVNVGFGSQDKLPSVEHPA